MSDTTLDSRLRGNEEPLTVILNEVKDRVSGGMDSRLRGNEEVVDWDTPPSPPRTRGGKTIWRSREALAATPESQEFLHREFQDGASELTDPMSRRSFLTIMGASAALASLAGCRRPLEKIVPYVKTPEEMIIGRPEQYATSAKVAGTVVGMLVTSQDGRPIKIEGNPLHTSSLGGTNAFMQAEILNVYDPDRSRSVRNHGAESDWASFVDFWRGDRSKFAASGGAGLAVLSPEVTSPTLERLRSEFLAAYPHAKWVAWEPVSDENIISGAKLAFGKPFRPVYDFAKAKVILSLDADFLGLETDSVKHTRQFAEGRKLTDGNRTMNRLYVAEPTFTVTGANADHRLRTKRSAVPGLVAGLAEALVKLGINVTGVSGDASAVDAEDRKWIDAVAKDLAANRGKSLVVAGRAQSPEVQAVVCAINDALGNVGETVSYTPATSYADSSALTSLIDSASQGSVNTVIVLGGNPAYNLPDRQAFIDALKRNATLITLAEQYDETAQIAAWHIPQAHFLEAWGDEKAVDGTTGITQPLIEPLFGGKSAVELVHLFTTGVEVRGYELVRDTWKALIPTDLFDKSWRRVLHDGILAGVAFAGERPALQLAGISLKSEDASGLEVAFQPSYSAWDGRYANNGWMQELPDPLTKLTWDNAALVSPTTAKRLGVESGDVIKLSHGGTAVEAAAFVQPGQADDSVTLTLGYGRKNLGRVADGAGFDAYGVRDASSAWAVGGVTLAKTGKRYPLSTSQDHGSMEGRPIVREGTLEEYVKEPKFAAEMVEGGPAPSLWEERKYDEGYQWGMVIDLNTCIGCNACSIACQSENNIPIVGKDQVARGREMHWIRLDRYYIGDENDPEAVTQPVACQHCEMAPCEQVCPVAATNHDHEGLNVMVYNRCVGTRYCANNCPYKARRFNFYNFTNELDQLVQMAQNPDVTVRSRGVMEKCTYCVQRINRGKHNAKMENRDVRDGEIVTACQAACPANAITFGNINDPKSEVAQMKKEERRYELLGELNARPRTSYLAKIRNPNPELND